MEIIKKGIIKQSKIIIDNFYDEYHDAKEINEEVDLDENLGLKITSLVRVKICGLFIQTLKNINNNKLDGVLKNISRLTKMVKIHLTQLKKLKERNYDITKSYLTDGIKVLYQQYFLLTRFN
jgi:hypothetical protein